MILIVHHFQDIIYHFVDTIYHLFINLFINDQIMLLL